MREAVRCCWSVSRVLSDRRAPLERRAAARTVISLGARSPAPSSSLPAASSGLRRRCRNGPFLAAYLALLRLGFTVPPLLPDARCALTAPFHPCLIPRCTEGHRRCVFCGTVRRSASRPSRPGVTWQPALWSPDFPRPALPVSRPSDQQHAQCSGSGDVNGAARAARRALAHSRTRSGSKARSRARCGRTSSARKRSTMPSPSYRWRNAPAVRPSSVRTWRPKLCGEL